MHRDMGRPSLAEAVVSETLGQNQRLERIDDAVDWERLGQVVAGVHAAARGRPSYPPLLMVKVLLLQQWYTLSDPQLEEALSDRLSFRRFVGLGLADDTPDHSTISRFRAALEAQGLSARLFAALAQQLEAQGLVLKQGTLLDATLVAAQVRRPPLAAGRGASSATDPDAAWTQTGRGNDGREGGAAGAARRGRAGIGRGGFQTRPSSGGGPLGERPHGATCLGSRGPWPGRALTRGSVRHARVAGAWETTPDRPASPPRPRPGPKWSPTPLPRPNIANYSKVSVRGNDGREGGAAGAARRGRAGIGRGGFQTRPYGPLGERPHGATCLASRGDGIEAVFDQGGA